MVEGVINLAIEEELKALVLSTYGSVREFSLVLDMPYSTLDSIFKRGVENASIANIIKICSALQISVDELASGKIVKRHTPVETPGESELLRLYQSVNNEGKSHILYTARLVAGNPDMQLSSYQSAAAIARQRANDADQKSVEAENSEARA